MSVRYYTIDISRYEWPDITGLWTIDCDSWGKSRAFIYTTSQQPGLFLASVLGDTENVVEFDNFDDAVNNCFARWIVQKLEG